MVGKDTYSAFWVFVFAYALTRSPSTLFERRRPKRRARRRRSPWLLPGDAGPRRTLGPCRRQSSSRASARERLSLHASEYFRDVRRVDPSLQAGGVRAARSQTPRVRWRSCWSPPGHTGPGRALRLCRSSIISASLRAPAAAVATHSGFATCAELTPSRARSDQGQLTACHNVRAEERALFG